MDIDKIKNITTDIYNELLQLDDGKVADYIPQLANVNTESFGISICTVSGEIVNIGDTNDYFCLQSCSKPLSYCISRKLNNLDKVHKHVGYEPSGRSFNSFDLNNDNLPHNPLINAGAIMVSSLIEPDKEPSDRFEIVNKYYQKMAGCDKLGYDNTIFLSEQHHADRNVALAYYMRENKAFDKNVGPNEISKHLDLYFQCCSITITSKMGAIIASTLANGGVCPTTNEKVFDSDISRDCLSLMYMCGMYDYTGQFAFEVGLPAKSGVSGCLFLVVPNKMGICIWSPKLDKMGNSVRGVEFCKRFIKKSPYDLHIFHTITNKVSSDNSEQLLFEACNSCDINKVKLLSKTMDINIEDYDKRRPLHIAVDEGYYDIIKVLIDNGASIDIKDRWNNTPISIVNDKLKDYKLSPELKHNYEKIKKLLNSENKVLYNNFLDNVSLDNLNKKSVKKKSII